MIRDVAAQNASLANDWGATKGPNAAASHELHLFAGNPQIPESEGGGVLLTGYTAPTITNNGTNWPTISGGEVVGILQDVTSTAAVDEADWYALKDPATGLWWDCGRLPTPVSFSTAGITHKVRPRIFWGVRGA